MTQILYTIIEILDYYTTANIWTLTQVEPKRVPIKVVYENNTRNAPYPPIQL